MPERKTTRRRAFSGSAAGLLLFSIACNRDAAPNASDGAVAPPDTASGDPQPQPSTQARTLAPSPTPVPTKEFTALPYPPPDRLGGSDWVYFRETGHYVSRGFKTYFEANGATSVLGYPITEELKEDGWTVQYFQRARLEFHPEDPRQPVQRSLLGDMLTQALPGLRQEERFQPLAITPSGGRFFSETGFAVQSPALEHFESTGGVAVYGYPISRAQNGTQWFQRARLEWSSGSVQTALIGDEYTDVIGLRAARERVQPPRIARADLPRINDRLDVHETPGGTVLVTRLPQDAQLRVTGEVTGPQGNVWYAVRLWNAVDGHVPVAALAFSPAPQKPPARGGGTTPKPAPKPEPKGPFPLSAKGRLRVDSAVHESPDGASKGQLTAGTAVDITAYATDGDGRAWVQLSSTAGTASQDWILADRFMVATPDPLTASVGGERLANRVAGTGMWFTYDVLRHTPVKHLIATAKASGFSFLAPEVGTSREGYWAREHFDALLPAAHAAGLKVIPWIYTWLDDLPVDLDLAFKAAQHVAPSGDRVDGVGIDIEETLDESAVRAYSHLVRAGVGPETLLVALTYQPQIASGQRTPYGVLAECFNVIAPMSYWHARPIRYSHQDAYNYVADSVQLIRERIGRPDVPVAVIGQTFDWFSRNEIGPNNPSAEEIQGAMQATKDTGALGIGFFNWFHTTPEEWEAMAQWS